MLVFTIVSRLVARRYGNVGARFSASGSTAACVTFGVSAGGQSSVDKWSAAIHIAGIFGVTALGVAYFVVVRQDGSVLLTLCSVIGGLVGYKLGQRKTAAI